jgi:CRP-like cAMP-binding protein
MEKVELSKFLLGVPIFSKLDRERRNRVVELLQKEEFDEGKQIIFKGEQGDKFYVIYEGVVAINDVYSDITLNRGVRTISNCPIRCLPANHAHCCWCERCQKHFGDVALLENKPRNADVFAQTDGRSRP